MHTLEVRRHSHRHTPASHLSQVGVDLARRVGHEMGKFDRVVTSTIPRAFETAIAMGYAVDEQIDQLSLMSESVQAIVQWDAGFAAWAKAAVDSSIVGVYTRGMADVWRSIVRRVPDGGRALIISHGGIVEAGTVGCLETSPLYTPIACGYCEGVRLTFDGDKAIKVILLRVDQP